MARPLLLDTGFLVALINAQDPDHLACAAVWSELRRPLVTVEGVLIEAAHLLRRTRGGIQAAWGLLQGSGTAMVPIVPEIIEIALRRMETYRSVPMDLVDGLLVAVAEEQGLHEVLTLDRRGFNTYRLKGRKAFSILP